MKHIEYLDLNQGSPEWHAIRKKKITATDASVIMKASPWKTPYQLYNEKLSEDSHSFQTARMQRGLELEPIARELFIYQTGIFVEPKVVVRDWAMASLDGIDATGSTIVEIKCPNEKDHSIATNGKVPSHYYPQLQHQMYVCDVSHAYYFSFDGFDGVAVKVERDDSYIEKMIEEEKRFLDCIVNLTPPESSGEDYIHREDAEWEMIANRWKVINNSIQALQREEEEIRKELIRLSGQSNTKGGGISLCQVQRKGNVDYSKIPELDGVDLDKYRKSSSSSWRITFN